MTERKTNLLIETPCQKIEVLGVFPIKIIHKGRIYYIKESDKGIYMNMQPIKKYVYKAKEFLTLAK